MSPKPERCKSCGHWHIREINGKWVCWKCGEVQ